MSAEQPITLDVAWDGSNIRTWVGFRSLAGLVQEAVRVWLRREGHGAGRLFHEHGLCVDLSWASYQLVRLVELDDTLDFTVHPTPTGLRVRATRAGAAVLKARVELRLVRDRRAPMPAHPWLCRRIVDTLPHQPAEEQSDAAWSWTARYVDCSYSRGVRHSTYVRVLEEAVIRFLDSRELSVPALLRDRGWIPVVSRFDVSVHCEVQMGERVQTSLVPVEILGDRAWRARLDCFVEREEIGRAHV
jgi:acyl-CoA thioesterase FadM